VEIYTIGFGKKTAEGFFGALRGSGIERLVDVRLNNVSQLAGFTKRDDLAFFLRELCQAEYHHEPLLAPSKELLDGYRSGKVDWSAYEQQYRSLLVQRRVSEALRREAFLVKTVLLCSEPTAERCHRRLAAEYLAELWGDTSIVHL